MDGAGDKFLSNPGVFSGATVRRRLIFEQRETGFLKRVKKKLEGKE